jgi:type I restriction enzyme R subunit
LRKFGIFFSCHSNRFNSYPKETKEVSNTDYFGDPIYTFIPLLDKALMMVFLAPYKVVRRLTLIKMLRDETR